MVLKDEVFCLTQTVSAIWDSPRGENLKVTVGNDCWIGHGAIILAGVKIEDGSIVAAGSLVNKDIQAYTIYAGVPAKKIKDRFETSEEKERHLAYLDKIYFSI